MMESAEGTLMATCQSGNRADDDLGGDFLE